MKVSISKPGTAKNNKTGDWRTFRPNVDLKKCIKCGTCQRFCPEGVMGEIGKHPEVDFDYCKGCGICAKECPVKAIAMSEDK